jgi:hypothetical protein
LKKFQGDDGWDFHASEHRHQNDQPIPELPESGICVRKGDFSFVGFHFLGWVIQILPKILTKKLLQKEPIF